MDDEIIFSVEKKNDCVLVRLQGDITKTTGEKILKSYNWQDYSEKIVVLDFEKVDYINSAGIAYLIRYARILSETKNTIRAYGLEYHYEKVFSIVGLNKFITVYPSEWAALEDIC